MKRGNFKGDTLSQFRIKTVSYKGSKRKLLPTILELINQANGKTIFDGFSGTGIVGAFLRTNGLSVTSNDLNYSSYLYGKVFLEGFEEKIVSEHIKNMNSIIPHEGWISKNYAGTRERNVRGENSTQVRTLGLTLKNSMKIDAAREYIHNLSSVSEKNKNALIFSTILGFDKVFNNSNDQKSSFKEWSNKSLKDVYFELPTLISGPIGTQYWGDIFSFNNKKYFDVIYLDPPYTSGVLYNTSYHINDSLALWDKPVLDQTYAIPRPHRACNKKNNKLAGPFYSKKNAESDFNKLLSLFDFKRIIMSYSDAPRNITNIKKLLKICHNFGKVELVDVEHKLCTQYSNQNKVSTSVKEYFIIIDR